MAFVVIFSLGYFIGGATALLLLGLTIAARRGDRGDRARRYHSAKEPD
jgi:hypothetical protein